MTNRDTPGSRTYRDAGVDNTGGSRAKARVGTVIRETFTDNVYGGFGHFGGMFRAPAGNDQILVSSADSVGTKVLLAVHAGRNQGIGVDLVNHSVNDILCCGARPLFFLDYFATSALDESLLADLVHGMANACRDASCALIGGETAQLPGIYQENTYDLAGFIVGSVSEDRIIDGSRIKPGHSVIGFASNGLHTNGYSLARAVFGLTGDDTRSIRERLEQYEPNLGESLGDALLRPHKTYLPVVSEILDSGLPSGLAHITGGGIAGNLERIIPSDCTAIIDASNWPTSPLFKLIQHTGKVSENEMFDVFNMGIGFIAVAEQGAIEPILSANADAHLIGEIVASSPGVARVEMRGVGGE